MGGNILNPQQRRKGGSISLFTKIRTLELQAPLEHK